MEDDFSMQVPKLSDAQKLLRNDTSDLVEAASVTVQHKDCSCPPLLSFTCVRLNYEHNAPAIHFISAILVI